jgi:hypothetical protein
LKAAAKPATLLDHAGHRENGTMTEQLTAGHFHPHVDKIFRVRGGRHALTLSCVEVSRPGGAALPAPLRQPFNLIFSGPPGDVLREGLYTLEVENGPHFELYVMPVHTPARDRQDYQAMFN